jgi:hypothetical protein
LVNISFKEEKFENVLKKYCEKRELDFVKYIMEFDGEQVDVGETPVDLDLDGGEIFDVRFSHDKTKINDKLYEFDDDVLIS